MILEFPVTLGQYQPIKILTLYIYWRFGFKISCTPLFLHNSRFSQKKEPESEPDSDYDKPKKKTSAYKKSGPAPARKSLFDYYNKQPDAGQKSTEQSKISLQTIQVQQPTRSYSLSCLETFSDIDIILCILTLRVGHV